MAIILSNYTLQSLYVCFRSQSGTSTSKLWLQQQAEECVQALDAATPALQPLFLKIAAHDQSSATNNISKAANMQAVEGTATAAQVGSNVDVVQQSDPDSSGNRWNGSRGMQGQSAWTAMTASLRDILQVLQQTQLLGTDVAPQQILAAFQDACYPGSQVLQQE